ncbi:MAG: PaaI family thioesterase [Rhodobacteraceae bacterium]|nr:PaaI family thioesterase [Paracoccaceae bacterium]
MNLRGKPEPVQVVKERRDATLAALVGRVPFIRWLGIRFERHGDELTAVLPYEGRLIGNADLPALHGGATAGFLEVAAVIELTWTGLWAEVESGRVTPDQLRAHSAIRMPKTVDFTIDYLRSGLPRESYARARVIRSGRRYASVHVEGWQDNRSRPFVWATGQFVMPQDRDG